ncbi:granulin a isoform X2 [Anabas testudineus]|uniref:Granulins domain-containing protein n=1 Tax=Anabas testudineus TaxID=64144 RepID=A0A3Q1JGG1_ANATE|nr:granulin a isoform X2 [Anabas testudineus]
MQWWVVICWALVTLVGADECPDGGTCERGQTCCNNPANGYECCPFDQAECCEDHMHCCPAGMICDVAQASCVNATECIPWVERVSAGKPRQTKSFRMIKTYMGEENDNICPDQSRCPPEFSCLRTLTRFGCCPLAQGVPCSDGKHCCPEGHQCSVDSRSCIKTELVTAVRCSDGVSECPDGTTCCETPEGKWGCCPMPKAVCCEDKIHCCPEGSTCDVEHSKCISLSTKKEMPMWAKLPARIRADWENKKGEQITSEAVDNGEPEKVPKVNTVNAVPPPVKEAPLTKAAGGNKVPCNDTAACEDGTTCCKTKDGGWACCPLPEAVCCKDFIHCCPKNTKCNLAAQTCDNDTSSVRWVEKVPAITKQGVQARDVQCDSATACPDGTTCCKTKEGGWACCPLPEAVCCEDFIHCCPKNTKCNLAAQTCDNKTMSVRWVEKVPAITKQGVQARDVQCDSATACPDGTTCCKTKEGGWACCPLPEAVCCEDFIHCCPKNTKCNLAAQTCDNKTMSVRWVEKVPAITKQGVQARDVQCDSATACPDGTTCCKTKEGGWACCPLPEAVCCDDFIHCCPKNTKCNLAAQTCDNKTMSVRWVEKVPAITKQGVQARDVQCDSATACPDGTTCCKTKEGGWACCPLPEAVCCEDFIHCCPKNTKCNLAAQTCDNKTMSVRWVEKVPAITKQGVQARNVTCDSTSSCPDDTTCCKNKTGGWACCPLPEAVCCDDHEHCCPTGNTCDLTTLTCQSTSGSTPVRLKKPAFTTLATTTAAPTTQTRETSTMSTEEEPKEPEEDEVMEAQEIDDDEEWENENEKENKNVQGRVLCDGHTSCPQYTTCCFMASARKWGCCPLPEAVCCADGNHCCPSHYRCDERKTSCLKGEVVIPWYTKLPATTSVEAHPSSEQCDDLNRCPKDTTCCKLSTGEWGCCPMKNGVCCQDHEHCCPQGYSCNMASKMCQQLQLKILPLTPVFLLEHQSPPSINYKDIPCDEKTSCKDGQTCCRMSATTWGCCPIPNAVCCSDMKHCCPAGYTCTDTGDCSKDIRLHWFDWHVFLANKKRALIV